MINIINHINKIFSANNSDSHFEENEIFFKAILCGDSLCLPNEDAFGSGSFINNRDWFSIVILDEFDESIDTYVNNGSEINYIEFKNEFQLQNNCKLKFKIHKSKDDQRLSIYSLSLFKEFIFKLKLKGLFFKINSLLGGKETKLILECLNDDICIGSNLLIFASPESSIVVNTQIPKKQREDLANKCKTVTHSHQQYNLIPDDFLLVIRDERHSDIEKLYNKLAIIYAVQFIFDFVGLNDNRDRIDYKLNGYKSMTHSLSFNTVSYSKSVTNAYFQIYQWIYNEGNLIDKIGLARNIISLNINKNNLCIEDRTFEAIKSSYKIYQTQNIKQYIEVRNKISDQLYDIYNKADEITDNFIGNFKKSIFTVISFLISVVAIRVISNGDFIRGFNTEVTILTIGLLIVSLIVMLYNRWEITEQIRRYENFYTNLKSRYTDLLDQSDVNRILNNDKDFSDSIYFIKSKRKYYTTVWVISIVVLLISIILIYCFNMIDSVVICKIIRILKLCYIKNI